MNHNPQKKWYALERSNSLRNCERSSRIAAARARDSIKVKLHSERCELLTNVVCYLSRAHERSAG